MLIQLLKPAFFALFATLTVVSFSQTIPKENKKQPVSTLYFFEGITGKDLCNKDSIITSDCINGNLLLTAKGNVVYEYYCCCDNPTVYDLGTYTVVGDKIVCTFTRLYTVGKGMEKNTKWKITLNKLKCPDYVYFFKEAYESDEDGKKGTQYQTYVLSKMSSQIKDEFIKEISAIKQLKGL